MFTLNAQFDAHVDQEETLSAVLEVLPVGTQATLQREPVLLDVPDLDQTHIGSSVRGQIGEPTEFGGALSAIYPGEANGRLLIVDGKPHTVRNYEVLQVIPPVTVGEHTPDEPEAPEAVESFDMTADDYNSAIELALQVTDAIADYMTPVAWISRASVEAVAGREVSDDEYGIVATATRDQLTEMLTPVAGSLIARNLALYRTIMGEEEKND